MVFGLVGNQMEVLLIIATIRLFISPSTDPSSDIVVSRYWDFNITIALVLFTLMVMVLRYISLVQMLILDSISSVIVILAMNVGYSSSI